MNHTAFFQLIKTQALSGAYLLHGEEEYVKNQALEALLSLVDEAARDLNVHILERADALPLTELCETLPFFSERRLIICRALPAKEDWERIAAYLPTMPESSLLCFAVRGKAAGNLSIVKQMKAQKRLVEFAMLEEGEAVKWLMQQALRYPVGLDAAEARFLVQLVGVSLYELRNEFVKAAGYVGAGGRLSRESIAASITKSAEYSVFAMIDCFLSGKKADGMRALDALLERESPFAIAALMAGRFKLMLEAKLLAEQGLDKNKAAARLGGSPYAAKLAYEAARRYSKEKLRENIVAFSDVGYQQISGRMKDREALELAVLRCAP